MKLTMSIIGLFLIVSCASKEEIYYLQDANEKGVGNIVYETAQIQPNDILKITVESSEPSAAIPYNRGGGQGLIQQNIQTMQLDGYLVSTNNTIDFPVLGEISTLNLASSELAEVIKNKLKEGGHLNQPSVNVRLINAKITILGEVNAPGTYTFTEYNISLLQALGYAGDLTINGKREDILITREVNGKRQITHIDLTSANFMMGPFYFVKPNDVIIVNPNNPKVKSAGFIGNFGNVATVISLALSITIY